MSTTSPIKSLAQIQSLKNYYLEQNEYRNYLLLTVCLNSALRICDVLSLQWSQVYDHKRHTYKTHITVKEKKTGKTSTIYINSNFKSALKLYAKYTEKVGYIFADKDNKPLSRTQAYRIIKLGGIAVGLEISCHSLRKTFGYHAWKTGIPPVMLMQIYNHSSFEVTKRYLGIDQEEKDSVFREVRL